MGVGREREFGCLERLSGDSMRLSSERQYRSHEARLGISIYLDEVEDCFRGVFLGFGLCLKEKPAPELYTKQLCTTSPR